jgi:hypothetical protein
MFAYFHKDWCSFTFPSGSHPFDICPKFDTPETTQLSETQNYRDETRLKIRIISGDMEFRPDKWNSLPDG